MRVDFFLSGYELIHHRVTQGITEFNQFEIKRIELRETLCYSVAQTHSSTAMNHTIADIHYVLYQSQNGTRLFLLLSFFFKGIKQAFPI